MNREQARILLEKHRAGTLSAEERAILESWYLDQGSNRQSVLSDEELQRNLRLVSRAVTIATRPQQSHSKRLWRIAAAVFIVVSIAALYFVKNGITPIRESGKIGHDVMPGGNRAILTLADGRAVSLRADQHRIIMGDEITYEDGTPVLSESVGERSTKETADLFTLFTPKGGIYEITLRDGTHIWLNAASSLRYPSHFGKPARMVTLEGEAYFEVAVLSSREGQKSGDSVQRVPFVVKSKGQHLTVLGTAFNVSSYADEPMVRTTLINGKVKVFAEQANREVLLVPGQEAVLSVDGIETRQANIASAVAWKSGKFRFDETELHDVMNQLSRWYDLEIEYKGGISERHFYGVINRNQPLSRVLDVLKEGGVNFSIEKTNGNNKLIVLP